jgi:putative thioredoxin
MGGHHPPAFARAATCASGRNFRFWRAIVKGDPANPIPMIDATLSTFERDVLEASSDAPVLVSFWAPWCEPCKALHPLLERLEREYGGRFRVVNVNTDVNPELVASFNLKSIPHVVAFVDSSAVSQFAGAQAEAFVRAFVDRLTPNPADIEHRGARDALMHGQVEAADVSLRKAIALDPSHDGARLDLVGLLLDRGELDTARSHFSLLSSHAVEQSPYQTVRARLDSAEIAATLPPEHHLAGRIAADGDDLQSRLDLADLYVARREFAPALDQLLEIVKRDRAFGEDVGRVRMLEVFDLAAAETDLVADYRERLSQLLF